MICFVCRRWYDNFLYLDAKYLPYELASSYMRMAKKEDLDISQEAGGFLA